MGTRTPTGNSTFCWSLLKVRIESVENDTVCVVDSFHGDANILCSRALTVCGFVNVFYPCSLEAGKRLSRARRRSVLAGLAVREGDLAETRLSDKKKKKKTLTRLPGSRGKLWKTSKSRLVWCLHASSGNWHAKLFRWKPVKPLEDTHSLLPLLSMNLTLWGLLSTLDRHM